MPGQISEANFEEKNGNLVIKIPLTSRGKFRCKNRASSTNYGVGFAPKTEHFTNESYVEWQIGYDVVVGTDGKNTSLKNNTFRGANGKTKYLYELSEIVWKLCKSGMISKKQITDLISEVDSYAMLLQESYQIKMNYEGEKLINEKFSKISSISLPTFTFDDDIEDEIFTEISIQKQQYATGVQPMVYLIIPILAFDNGQKIIGKNSSEIPFGIYTVSSKGKASNFLKIFSYFGFCSSSHQHDILEILKIIRDCAF